MEKLFFSYPNYVVNNQDMNELYEQNITYFIRDILHISIQS